MSITPNDLCLQSVSINTWQDMTSSGAMLVIWAIVLQQVLGAIRNTEGSEFLIAFLENSVLPNQGPKLQCIFITTRHASATAEVSSLDASVNYSESLSLGLGDGAFACIDNNIQLSGDGISSKLLAIKANVDISVMALDHEAKSVDSYKVIPTAFFGKDYYVLSMPMYGNSGFLSEFCIIATQNSTAVTIEFPSDGYYELEYQSLTVINPGTFTLTLQANEVFQLQNPTDMTGVYISADQPIGVVSGHQKSGTGASWNIDHFGEQMTPIVTWGTEFVTVPTPQLNTTHLDVYRVLASTPNTTIFGDVGFWELEKEGDYVDISVPSLSPLSLRSNKAVLVVKYVPNFKNLADTCIMIIVPNNQWMTMYTFMFGSPISNGYLIVVVPTVSKDTLMISNSALTITNWIAAIPGNMSVGFLPLSAGTYTLSSTQDVPFMAYVHQGAREYAFCSAAGMNLHQINANWTHTQPTNITTTCTTTAAPTTVTSTAASVTTENPTTTVMETTTSDPTTTATTSTSTTSTTAAATTGPLTAETTVSQQGNDTNCGCKDELPKTPLLNVTEDDLKLLLKILQTSLRINRNETSKYIRTKISIPDFRPVPTSLGVFGSALISVTVVLIFLYDLSNLMNHLFRGPFYNIQIKPKEIKAKT